MITKEKSQKIKQLKYLLIVPLLLGMLLYVSCSDNIQTNIEQVENVLKEENIPTEGKYFRADNGFILFTGNHLSGEVIPFEDYTEKEKKIFNKFINNEHKKNEMSFVIDTNGDRVFFIKTNNLNIAKYEADEDDDSVPFSKIEEVPVFPGCVGDKVELTTCLQENITTFVSQNFNSNLANELGLKPGLKRIFVMFKINKEGNITDVKARAPHKTLEVEAIRVINSLPKMTPGKNEGVAMDVNYSLPIAFVVDEKTDVKDTASSDPIYLLNGKEITKEEMNKISQDKIKSVNVIKDEKKLSKYGEKAKNGLVEIFLKE